MDNSTLITIALSIGGVVVTVVNAWMIFAMKNIREDTKTLFRADQAQAAAIAGVRELVLGKYITREELKDILAGHTQAILASVQSLTTALNRHMDEEDARMRMALQQPPQRP